MYNALGNSLCKSAPSSGLLLRQYGGAAAAYSLQRLSQSIENVVRVRRSSDSAEADFTAQEVKDGTLAAFCGAGDGFVTTWYDQSGNGRNAAQASAGAQPKIISSGSLILNSGSNPTLLFDGAATSLRTTYSVAITAHSFFTVATLTSGGPSGGRLYSHSDATVDTASADIHQPALQNATNQAISAYDGAYLGISNVTFGNQFLWSCLHSGSLISPFLNGSAATTSAQTLNKTITRQSIGEAVQNASWWKGNIAEVIVYNTNQAANRTKIETNIAARYGIALA